MKKVVICGAAGFVGQNLVQLLKDKFNIIAIDKNRSNLELLRFHNPEIEIIISDLAEKSDWQFTFEDAHCIIELNAEIASFDKEVFIRNNVISTKNIIDAMENYEVPYIIHVSSAAVNSVRKDYYAITKEEGEKICQKSNVNYTILRPSMMYGCFDNKSIGWLLNFINKFPLFPIPGHGRYPRQPVYVIDFCKIIEKLIMTQPKNKIYDINGDVITFIDMIRMIIQVMELNRFVVLIPVSLFGLLMHTYSKIIGKTAFTSDQLLSLISGEIFDMYPWWSEFNVRKTTFKKGLDKMLKSDCVHFRLEN